MSVYDDYTAVDGTDSEDDKALKATAVLTERALQQALTIPGAQPPEVVALVVSLTKDIVAALAEKYPNVKAHGEPMAPIDALKAMLKHDRRDVTPTIIVYSGKIDWARSRNRTNGARQDLINQAMQIAAQGGLHLNSDDELIHTVTNLFTLGKILQAEFPVSKEAGV